MKFQIFASEKNYDMRHHFFKWKGSVKFCVFKSEIRLMLGYLLSLLGSPLCMFMRVLLNNGIHLCLCVGFRDEWGAEDVGDLPPGGGAQRSRPSASGEESDCQHTKVQHTHTYIHTNLCTYTNMNKLNT